MAADDPAKTFQILRSPCVGLSQSALTLSSNPKDARPVIDSLRALRTALLQAEKIKGGINLKIADYVFFPISHVLRQLEKLPIICKELALQNISVLLATAWSENIAAPLGMQLLILLGFLGDFKDRPSSSYSEELLSITLTCLRQVLEALSKSGEGREALLSAKHMPHVGKAMSVILDSALLGPSPSVQSIAVDCTAAFVDAIYDDDALAISFLPGIVSCLTKIIASSGTVKRSADMIARSIGILTILLIRLFSDEAIKHLTPSANVKDPEIRVRDQAWVTATSPQLHAALSSVVKQRNHDRAIVTKALYNLCSSILSSCQQALAASSPMLLDTVLSLASRDTTISNELNILIGTQPGLVDTLKESTLTWTTALPRNMLANDDSVKSMSLAKIVTSRKILEAQGLDNTLLDGAIIQSVRDCMVSMFQEDNLPNKAQGSDISASNIDIRQVSLTKDVIFEPLLGLTKTESAHVNDLQSLLNGLTKARNTSTIASGLASTLSIGSKSSRGLADFWLALQYLKELRTSSDNVSAYLIDSYSTNNGAEEMMQMMYSYSVTLLSEGSEVVRDWRFNAMALEIVALQAKTQGEEFRPELIDVLYPILLLMGSADLQLSQHAMTCLNVITKACGYKSSSAIVVENVDYLINAVALRLNNFDITPQAPLVMIMMIKLTGSSILPHLDDLVDTIFFTLDSFHGYTKLVRMLFQVLQAVVEEGAKTPSLITSSDEESEGIKHQQTKRQQITDIIASISALQQREKKSRTEVESEIGAAPHEPWKKANDAANEDQDDAGQGEDESPSDQAVTQPSEDKPPAPRIYSLIMKIADLTQHYLPSESPELRKALLSVLITALPALAQHENSFLPFINTIWPILVHRLEDSEAYVVAEALNVVNGLCSLAGDFIKSRIEDLWPVLQRLLRKRIMGGHKQTSQTRMLQGGQESSIATTLGALSISTTTSKTSNATTEDHYYIQTPTRLLWKSLTTLLSTIIKSVPISDTTFDEMLEILLPVMDDDDSVRSASEARNPDAVWLARLRQQGARGLSGMHVNLPLSTEQESLMQARGWRFVEVV